MCSFRSSCLYCDVVGGGAVASLKDPKTLSHTHTANTRRTSVYWTTYTYSSFPQKWTKQAAPKDMKQQQRRRYQHTTLFSCNVTTSLPILLLFLPCSPFLSSAFSFVYIFLPTLFFFHSASILYCFLCARCFSRSSGNAENYKKKIIINRISAAKITFFAYGISCVFGWIRFVIWHTFLRALHCTDTHTQTQTQRQRQEWIRFNLVWKRFNRRHLYAYWERVLVRAYMKICICNANGQTTIVQCSGNNSSSVSGSRKKLESEKWI